jgi:hypothetical protein
VVFARDSTLLAVPFDLSELAVMGNPVPLGINVAANPPTGAAQFVLGREGTLVYAPGGPGDSPSAPAVRRDRKGQVQPAFRAPVRCENLTVAPDGERIAFTIVDAQNEVGVYDLRNSTLTRLTFDAAEDVYPIWTRNGQMITFVSSRDGPLNLYQKAADGNGPETRLTRSPYDQGPCDWTPDGGALIYTEDHPETGSDLWLLPASPPGRPHPLLRTAAEEHNARISPDGRWMAYESNESGRREIYVAPFPEGKNRWQVSRGGGQRPSWSSRGDELFYVGTDQWLVAVGVQMASGFRISGQKKLFSMEGFGPDYDVAPDGQSFVTRSPDRGLEQLVVVTRWASTFGDMARVH